MIRSCPDLRRLYVDSSFLRSYPALSTSIASTLPHLEDVRLIGTVDTILASLPGLKTCPRVTVDALKAVDYGGADPIANGSLFRPSHIPTFAVVSALLLGMGPIEELHFVGARHSELLPLANEREHVLFRSSLYTRGLRSVVSDVDFELVRDCLDAVVTFAFNAVYWQDIMSRVPRLPAVRTFAYVVPHAGAVFHSSIASVEWDLPALECLVIGTDKLAVPKVALFSFGSQAEDYNYEQDQLQTLIRGACAGLRATSFHALNRLVLVNIGIRGMTDDRDVERALSGLATQVEVRRDRNWDGASV